jgi:hypothetical protein
MERVNAADIKRHVIAYEITEFLLNYCVLCETPSCYRFRADQVSFHSGCEHNRDITYCLNRSCDSSYEAVATSFNRLTPKERMQLWNVFVRSGEPVGVIP